MRVGNSLFQARKRRGLSQEAVAERLGVSRQTISKWETDETVPDIYQAKKMASLYGIALDELISFDAAVSGLRQAIEKTNGQAEGAVDWTSEWGKSYPVLLRYQAEVGAQGYARSLDAMLDELRQKYHYEEQDAMLVLKDILYQTWKSRKKRKQDNTRRPLFRAAAFFAGQAGRGGAPAPCPARCQVGPDSGISGPSDTV